MTRPTGGGHANRTRWRTPYTTLKDAISPERRDLRRTHRDTALAKEQVRPLPPWLAHRARRALATLVFAPLACGLASAYMTPESNSAALLNSGSLFGWAVGFLVLRRVTRLLTDVPDTLLDEREKGDRDKAVHLAYKVLIVGLTVLVVIAANDPILDPILLDPASWSPLAFGLFFTALLLPSGAAAWQSRDLDNGN